MEEALLLEESESTPPIEESECVPPSAPARKQSQVLEEFAEKTSGSHGYALYGSLSLIPEFGPKGILESSSAVSKCWFTILFCTWWSTVSMGVLSSLFPRTSFDVFFAHFTSWLGMIDINILVIMYTCWLLKIDTNFVLGGLLTFVILGHIVSAIWHYCHGRGSD